MKKVAHGYQIVSLSPWPFTTSISLGCYLISLVMLFHNIEGGFEINMMGLISLMISINWWIKDIITEGTYKGEHTKVVEKNLKDGFILFVVSEAVIFITLFYIYFYNALIPNIFIGGIYPPIGIETIAYEGVPLLNTALLFFGSLTMTGGHHSTLGKNYNWTKLLLIFTIICNTIFTLLQIFEYYNSPFNITDSVYGSAFFITTGLHGLHVILGTLMVIYTLMRLYAYQFTDSHHLGLWSSTLYLHFVDLVWLIVLVLYYIWGC